MAMMTAGILSIQRYYSIRQSRRPKQNLKRFIVSIPSIQSSWINGKQNVHHDDDEGGVYDNLSPIDGRRLCRVQQPSKETIEKSIRLSENAFPEWSSLRNDRRRDILREMASRLKQHAEEFVELETLDTGIPISQVRTYHVQASIDVLEYYASLSWCDEASTHPLELFQKVREPLGVCVGLGSWNYPLWGMMVKLAPALLCGNTMIYKPSECTPLSALYFAEKIDDLLPPNVLQVLVATVAHGWMQHDSVRKVSLTGSVETGRYVAQQAGRTLKRVTLELGGKSPLVVLEDAHLDLAIRIAAEGNFLVNNGQVCSNCTRIFVHRSMARTFLDGLCKYLDDTVRMGNPLSESTNMGPLMMYPEHPSKHYDRVMGFLNRALSEKKVELVYGGEGYQEGGFFVRPTVFLALSDSVEIVREEIFGPIMTVLVYDTVEEAIRRANDSPYGLAAGIVSRDLDRAKEIAKHQLQAGVVYINSWNEAPVDMPFGGIKQSGYGKELGVESLYEYSQIKSIYCPPPEEGQ